MSHSNAATPSKPHALATIAIHAGGHPDVETGAIAPPIHLSTTYEHPADTSMLTGYIYQRYKNPTQDRLEAALAALESDARDAPAHALFYGTGLAAVAGVVAQFRPGMRILLADDCYFAARKLMLLEAARIGFEVELVDMTDDSALQSAFSKKPDWVWAETPSNPLLKITDIARLAQRCQAAKATLVVDATFATPALLQPLALGADVVMHSATKYLAGHSDCMGGVLVMRSTSLYQQLADTRTLQGNTASPFAAWLTLRGIRTLLARLRWQCESAAKIASALAAHPRVARVHYPGLPSHPQHAIAKAQMRDFGAMLSFELAGENAAAQRAHAIAVASRLQLFINATSLGSVESLVEHRQSSEGPSSTSPPGLLRLSIGLEASADLLADLMQALDE
jgi:cystathionine gamma-synthase